MHSLNEITALAHKAGRGAGLDDGTALDCARAAARAVADGKPGLEWWSAALADLARLRETVAAADLANAGETVDAPSAPLFPYLLDSAPVAGHGAFAVDETAWATLTALAHRTYVPATEASRLAGAGAGTTDND